MLVAGRATIGLPPNERRPGGLATRPTIEKPRQDGRLARAAPLGRREANPSLGTYRAITVMIVHDSPRKGDLMLLALLVGLQAVPTLEALEGQKAWKPHDHELAALYIPGARDNLLTCYSLATTRLSLSDEAPETIASAVLGSCVDDEAYFRRVFVLNFRGSASIPERASLTEKIISEIKHNVREQVISEIVTARMARTH